MIIRIPLYIDRCVQWHSHLGSSNQVVKVFVLGIDIPTLSYLVATQDSSHSIQLAPSSSHVRSKCNANTLVPANLVRVSISVSKVDLRVYLAPIPGFPAGLSKGATILLSIRSPKKRWAGSTDLTCKRESNRASRREGEQKHTH